MRGQVISIPIRAVPSWSAGRAFSFSEPDIRDAQVALQLVSFRGNAFNLGSTPVFVHYTSSEMIFCGL